MTPAARVQAAIELLDEVLKGRPAEQALTRWARGARYAGSKDRAAVRDHVFQALRCKRSYAALGGAESGRGLMLGALREAGTDLSEVFTGARHAPESLTPQEAAAEPRPLSPGEAHDLPDWLWQAFEASLGAEAAAAAQALRSRAPVTLRVNTRMNTRAQAIEILSEDSIASTPCTIADTALRVTEGARRVAQSQAYLSGAVELQDASSQAAMAALSPPPGARVLDYCAGGGGKVLALAARHDARWFAHDSDPARMADLPARAARAGAEIGVLAPGHAAQAARAAPFDLVLCDAPCSGSGTWRRSPDAKWRLTPERLAQLTDLQSQILTEAAGLVTEGGQLAYATCSVLRAENEDRVAAFLASHPGWAETSCKRWSISPEGDGFFLSVLQKR